MREQTSFFLTRVTFSNCPKSSITALNAVPTFPMSLTMTDVSFCSGLFLDPALNFYSVGSGPAALLSSPTLISLGFVALLYRSFRVYTFIVLFCLYSEKEDNRRDCKLYKLLLLLQWHRPVVLRSKHSHNNKQFHSLCSDKVFFVCGTSDGYRLLRQVHVLSENV
jgi:hypothetical protein